MKPINFDIDIFKALRDDNDDWIVEGVASTSRRDYENEKVLPEGLDLSYFLKKGFIKYEHGKSPKQFIGEPLEARVTPQGFYLKGKLYKNSALAGEAVEALETLKKSGAKRGLHWSIEASTLARDPRDPRTVTKAIVRNVVLTFNPMNDDTWARLCKSFDKIEWGVDLEDVCTCGKKCGANCSRFGGKGCNTEKSFSTATASGQAMMPESLEGGVKPAVPVDSTTDEYKKKLKLAFAKYMRYILTLAIKKHKATNKSLVADLTSEDKRGALTLAMAGLLPEESELLGSYINKSVNIDLLAKKFAGGECGMDSKELEATLDSALTDLNKSLGVTEEELEKSMGSSAGEREPGDIESANYVAGSASEDDASSAASDDGTEGTAQGDGVIDKSFAKDFASKDDSIEKALEVSDFLEVLVGAVGDSIDSFGNVLEKSMTKNGAVQTSMAKVLSATGTLIKSLSAEVVELRTENASTNELLKSLQTQLDVLAGRPVGRKSVVNLKEATTLTKSITGAQGSGKPQMTKTQIVDVLVKSFEKGDDGISAMDVTRFETTGTLRPEVAVKLGLAGQ